MSQRSKHATPQDRRQFVRAATTAAVGACVSSAAAAGPVLRGVWKIVSYTRDGATVDLDAMMIITARHFSRVESERARKPFAFDFRKLDALTPAQVREVAESFVGSNASSGTYRIENDVFYFTSVTHHNPGALGHEAKRRFTLTGDRLRFSGPAGSGELEEVWERVESL